LSTGKVCLGKDLLKDLRECEMLFLRDRGAFLVGASKHGSRMGREAIV
jgi:hypothetical protein